MCVPDRGVSPFRKRQTMILITDYTEAWPIEDNNPALFNSISTTFPQQRTSGIALKAFSVKHINNLITSKTQLWSVRIETKITTSKS